MDTSPASSHVVDEGKLAADDALSASLSTSASSASPASVFSRVVRQAERPVCVERPYKLRAEEGFREEPVTGAEHIAEPGADHIAESGAEHIAEPDADVSESIALRPRPPSLQSLKDAAEDQSCVETEDSVVGDAPSMASLVARRCHEATSTSPKEGCDQTPGSPRVLRGGAFPHLPVLPRQSHTSAGAAPAFGVTATLLAPSPHRGSSAAKLASQRIAEELKSGGAGQCALSSPTFGVESPRRSPTFGVDGHERSAAGEGAEKPSGERRRCSDSEQPGIDRESTDPFSQYVSTIDTLTRSSSADGASFATAAASNSYVGVSATCSVEQRLTLARGTQVDYWSESHGRWVPATVGEVDAESGAVALDVTPGRQILPLEQKEKLRRRVKPSQVQLAWARGVLREGGQRLQSEAQAFFNLHARAPAQLDSNGNRPMPILRQEDLPALAAELDLVIGLSCTLPALQRDVRATEGHTLSSEGFARFFSNLLWRVECECGQVLITRPRRREEDPRDVYVFDQTLGTGVYGPVRSAQSRRTGMTHAVKVLKRDGLTKGSREERERLEHEFEHLRRLDHPNIVRLYEHFETDEGLFLVMDYCSGGQLQAMIAEARSSHRGLPMTFVADVTRQVLSAMAHMHARSVVHLDLSGENVLLMPGREPAATSWYSGYTLAHVKDKPHVVVIDFGVAQVLRPGVTRCAPASFDSTLAPEVWHGDITPRADVFSCGALLFEMLGLMEPFERPRDFMEAVNYWNTKPKPPWKELDKVPRDAVELCRKMLHVDRCYRPEAAQCYHISGFLQESDSTCCSLGHAARLGVRVLQRLVDVPGRSWLHKSLALSIARSLTVSQLPLVKRVFHALDVTGVGRLDKSHIIAALVSVEIQGPLACQIADAMDVGREGKVTWTEFVAACTDLSSAAYDEHLRRAFEAADSDGDDLLSQEDIASMFATDHLCNDVARDVFVEMTGREEDGARIDWPTFRQHFVAGPRYTEGGSGTTCGQVDVSTAVRDGLADFVVQAKGLWNHVGSFWAGSNSPKNRGPRSVRNSYDIDEVQEEKLSQLEKMGFDDRERCASALRRHRGDVRRAVLEELVDPTPGPPMVMVISSLGQASAPPEWEQGADEEPGDDESEPELNTLVREAL